MADPVERQRGPLGRLADAIAGLSGCKAVAAATASGALLAGALPPFHIMPFAVIGFTMLIWQLQGRKTGRGGFPIGWAFGFGFYATGLYWIGNSFSIRSADLAPLAPLAIGGLAAALGVFVGLVGAAQTMIAARSRFFSIVLLAALWTLAEMARGSILTGFPWNLAATIWPLDMAVGLAVSQSVKAIGAYGLSFLTVLLCASPAALIFAGQPGAGRPVWFPLACIVLFVAMGIGGGLNLPRTAWPSVPDVTLRLVQPSIPQRQKWDRALRSRNLGLYRALSRQPSSLPERPVTHVIWPETAATFPLALDDEARRELASAVTPKGGLWIAGAPRVAPAPADRPADRRIWNSLHAMTADGGIVATYDKAHLVPFGEYMPLRGYLPFEKIVHGTGDFSAGPGVTTLRLPGLPPVTPLICYEIIFPGAVVGPTSGGGPKWLLNLTNDAWFGASTGPHQHLASARFRAIEEGLPVVRSANTGVSAVIDPFGRIERRLALGETGILDSALPTARPTTAWTATRFWFGPVLSGGVVLLGLFLRFRRSWPRIDRIRNAIVLQGKGFRIDGRANGTVLLKKNTPSR